MNNRSVGIFRLNFPEISETFIRAQMSSYQSYRPRVFAKSQLGESVWPVSAVSTFGKSAERMFLATRSTRWHTKQAQDKPNLLHAHFGVDGVYALPLARKLNIPLVTTFHGFDILTRLSWWAKHPTLPAAVYLAHLGELKREGARFIAVSRFIERALVKRGFSQDKITQHYIGVDTEKFHPNPLRRDAENPYVLCVGRHVGFKGIDVLLKAYAKIAKRYEKFRLLLVGHGPDTAKLKQLAEALGLGKKVEFLGAQPHARVLELLQGAEVFVLPSLTHESGRAEALGIVFNEASACGIPIVSTFNGGIPEVVLDGETGLLCPERDEDVLADRLSSLLDDPALRAKFGARGREYVCECFDLKRQTEKLERIYDEVLA